jgi:hypothetical protein
MRNVLMSFKNSGLEAAAALCFRQTSVLLSDTSIAKLMWCVFNSKLTFLVEVKSGRAYRPGSTGFPGLNIRPDWPPGTR